ncbi:hypothetical protein ACF073_40695 [Streptomyces sp. NPDC015171]|uniref:hypothetical protein n=1 Tax=Streptomyces sp. NPDC015171 TaxID=3364945 RepID=UPI003702B9C6
MRDPLAAFGAHLGRQLREGAVRCVDRLPQRRCDEGLLDQDGQVLGDRADQAVDPRVLTPHTCAERERALAEAAAATRAARSEVAPDLADAIVGLRRAPVGTRR